MPTRRTCTGLRVACADCIANTMLAAIRRHRVAACSLVGPTATSPGASAVARPSSVQCTVARNAACNTVQTQPTQSKQTLSLISHTKQRLTTTSLCVARVGPVAYTILAAIGRRRIAAISALNPSATSFRARTKIGPSTVQRTVASNAVYKAAKYALGVVIPYQVRP